jgi:hypothetical protein
MKMISSTKSTSINGITFGSAVGSKRARFRTSAAAM